LKIGEVRIKIKIKINNQQSTINNQQSTIFQLTIYSINN